MKISLTGNWSEITLCCTVVLWIVNDVGCDTLNLHYGCTSGLEKGFCILIHVKFYKTKKQHEAKLLELPLIQATLVIKAHFVAEYLT